MSYVRVSILGTSPGGEVWSINPVFDPTFEFPGTPSQPALDSAAAAIAALTPGSTMLACQSTALFLTGARVEVRDDATDHLLGLSIASRATPLAGTGTPRMPPQNAIVTSLRTNTPGASGRGRLYWPAVGSTIFTDLKLTAGDAGGMATNMKAYLTSMASALATAFPTIGFDLAVRSKTTKTTPHVARITVGNVYDTQRRRRDAYLEQYISTPVP